MTGDSSLFLRLPSYRESQLRRYHPYPRVERSGPRLSSVEDAVEPNHAGDGDTTAYAGHVEGADASEEDRANLERAMYGEEGTQRRPFVALVIALAHAVRRGYNNVLDKFAVNH